MYQRRATTLKCSDVSVWIAIIMVISNVLGTAECAQTTQKLIKDQFVDCHSDRMDVHLRFFMPFDGFIYAENYHEKPSCSWYGNTTKYMKLTIPFQVLQSDSDSSSSTSGSNNDGPSSLLHTNDSYCGAEIDRSNGRISAVLVVSPLVGVLVSGTTNLQVSCLYMVRDFTVTFPQVHIVPIKAETDLVTGLAVKPTLFMQILEDHGISGAVLTEANIGQRITLDIVLENAAIYDFTIYSCIAHDGSRSPDASVQIIDANGCGVPLVRAIDEQIYNATINGAKHVYIYMYGFQFTSSEFVHFECQARTCVHSCLKQQCTTAVNLTSEIVADNDTNVRKRRYSETEEQINLTLYTMLQMKPQILNSAKLESPSPESKVASSSVQSLTLASILAAAIVLVTVAFSYMCYLKRRKRSVDMSDYHSASSLTDTSLYTNQARSFVYL